MSRPLAACLVFSLLGAGAASAGTVYVPVPDPVSTGSSHVMQVWVSNTGTVQRPYSTTLLEAETDGTKRPSSKPPEVGVAAGRTVLLTGLGAQGKVRLLELNANSQLTVEARVVNTPSNNPPTVSPVPVISSENLLAAGKTAVLQGLARSDTNGTVTSLGVVNLSHQATQCEIRLFRADGSQIGAAATLSFSPLSVRSFPDAFGLLNAFQVADARIQVSCGQPFYAFATLLTPANGQLMFVTPAASGESTLTAPGDSAPPPAGGSNVFSVAGTFHTATTANPKKTYTITLAEALSLRRLVLDMDFTVGPWNRSKIPGNHALVWLYRDKFRGNTIANVNAFSPTKSSLKAAQNINLGPQEGTQDEGGVAWQQGKRYHLRYTYDAAVNTITVVLSSGGATIKTLSFPGTAPNGVLSIPAKGLTVEFGHYAGQEGPEVASYGWSYSDLRIEMTPY